ncbi:hypothetical protein BDQ94DRAFT_135642 [Aspergillus welwitschiae]|uniref:Uncharacterized protein n=1 Tax=Aspergillus welwitschiae TaxID=1341132 RepID=A0A3F3QG98_9EURO|nr:hypothetical protein BDQ94DRAFT_135642 [Aspergillus welwitschiae]RDH38090.1 hypothetical protein BDQ94DRAFT_135642 [Aspergillus welwitschiae]
MQWTASVPTLIAWVNGMPTAPSFRSDRNPGDAWRVGCHDQRCRVQLPIVRLILPSSGREAGGGESQVGKKWGVPWRIRMVFKTIVSSPTIYRQS